MLSKKPSVILLGSKPGSAVALSILLLRKWDIKCVVPSQSSSTRSHFFQEIAKKNGIRIIQKQSELKLGQKVDFVISYMFRHRVKPEIIALGQRAALNFHAGPLPEFGGWAFYNVAILENTLEYGCTCHYMDNEFDSGPILKMRLFPIDPSQETALTLEKKSQEEMIKLFIDFCNLAESGQKLPKIEQDRSKRRYLSKDEFLALKEIPPGSDEKTIDRYARAFWYPLYDCAYIKWNNFKVEVIPKIAKEQICTKFFEEDFQKIENAAKLYSETK